MALGAAVLLVGRLAIRAGPALPLGVDERDGALVREHSPVLGPSAAPVTIVEFFDPACEACRAAHPVLDGLRERYPGRVRVVMRYASFRGGPDDDARVLEAARRQARFEPVLEALYAARSEWARDEGIEAEAVWRIAADAGLDVERARADASLATVDAALALDAADAVAVGVRRTPTFFVNGRPLRVLGPDRSTASTGEPTGAGSRVEPPSPRVLSGPPEVRRLLGASVEDGLGDRSGDGAAYGLDELGDRA